MTSVISEFSQNPYGVSTAELSGGNGSSPGDNGQAIATIDPRYGNAFIIDTTELTNGGAPSNRVYIRVKSAKANVGALLPGKVIHLLFKKPIPILGATKSVTCYLDTTLGSNLSPLESNDEDNGDLAISLIANGNKFTLLSCTPSWVSLE
jgi:hypothetical protein